MNYLCHIFIWVTDAFHMSKNELKRAHMPTLMFYVDLKCLRVVAMTLHEFAETPLSPALRKATILVFFDQQQQPVSL